MNENFLAAYRPQLLSLFRFMTGLLLFQYGVAKILKFPPGTMFEKVELFSLIGLAGSLELILGALLIVGLFSRIAAFILAGEMAFAYFIGHVFKTGSPVWLPVFNMGTAAALFCFACLYLAAAGPGPLSLDTILRKKS
jgi:putative oxidoreductase